MAVSPSPSHLSPKEILGSIRTQELRKAELSLVDHAGGRAYIHPALRSKKRLNNQLLLGPVNRGQAKNGVDAEGHATFQVASLTSREM